LRKGKILANDQPISIKKMAKSQKTNVKTSTAEKKNTTSSTSKSNMLNSALPAGITLGCPILDSTNLMKTGRMKL
ncbi:16393_t:CDS:1, partial [Dentiscutata heterogama]